MTVLEIIDKLGLKGQQVDTATELLADLPEIIRKHPPLSTIKEYIETYEYYCEVRAAIRDIPIDEIKGSQNGLYGTLSRQIDNFRKELCINKLEESKLAKSEKDISDEDQEAEMLREQLYS